MSLIVFVCACSSTATNYSQFRKDVDTREMVRATVLQPADIFEVRVYMEPELSGTFRVSPLGTIDYPLLGAVKVSGLTPSMVALLIRQKLKQGQLYRDPYVTVFVKEYRSKKVFVLGQVAKPGTFPFSENMSIVEAISLAGGFTDRAKKNYIIVTRVEQDGEKQIPVPVQKISEGIAKNFWLRPGDIIFVPESIL